MTAPKKQAMCGAVGGALLLMCGFQADFLMVSRWLHVPQVLCRHPITEWKRRASAFLPLVSFFVFERLSNSVFCPLACESPRFIFVCGVR